MLLPAGIIGIIIFVNTEETKKYWQGKTDEEVLKAATEDIRKILPKVRPFVKDEAIKRGLIDRASLKMFDKPKIYILMKNKWIACPVCSLILIMPLIILTHKAQLCGPGKIPFFLSYVFIVFHGFFWLAKVPRRKVTIDYIVYVICVTIAISILYQICLILLALASGWMPA